MCLMFEDRWRKMIEWKEIIDFMGLRILNDVAVDNTFTWEEEVLNICFAEMKMNFKFWEVFIQDFVDYLNVRFAHLSQSLDWRLGWEFKKFDISGHWCSRR